MLEILVPGVPLWGSDMSIAMPLPPSAKDKVKSLVFLPRYHKNNGVRSDRLRVVPGIGVAMEVSADEYDKNTFRLDVVPIDRRTVVPTAQYQIKQFCSRYGIEVLRAAA